ncbi:MAG: polysaccharide deacetylase family protein [Clostridiales bacterium]|nr:polysaccharide deacetylase family protein [Clostridiales bacterium]
MNSIRMRFPGGRVKAFTMSYDDGVEQDVKLISIMRYHALKGTFNLNSGQFAQEGTVYPKGQVHRRMTQAACVKTYTSYPGCEVAVHGSVHGFWNALPEGLRTLDIIRDREALEKVFDRLVRGAAYPYGTYDEQAIAALESCGIEYCRTTRSTHAFDLPERWLEWHPTCHHNDPALMELADSFLNNDRGRTPLLFYLWGHSYEFEGADNWQVIEAFADRISGHADVWYATNIEIHDYTEAFWRLRFSAEGDRVFNPNCTRMWFAAEDNTYMVEPGQELKL